MLHACGLPTRFSPKRNAEIFFVYKKYHQVTVLCILYHRYALVRKVQLKVVVEWPKLLNTRIWQRIITIRVTDWSLVQRRGFSEYLIVQVISSNTFFAQLIRSFRGATSH